MPLTHLLGLFEGTQYTPSELVVHRHRWLFAQKCEVWGHCTPDIRSTILLVYRSPLVMDTSPMYQKVSRIILESPHVEVITRNIREDSEMMHGSAELLIIRTYTGPERRILTPEKIRSTLCSASNFSTLTDKINQKEIV